jgi:hypothetical protein
MNKLFCGECKKLLNYINKDSNELISFETCKKSKIELSYKQKCMSCGFMTKHIKVMRA